MPTSASSVAEVSRMFGQLDGEIKVEFFHGYAAFFKPAPL